LFPAEWQALFWLMAGSLYELRTAAKNAAYLCMPEIPVTASLTNALVFSALQKQANRENRAEKHS